MRRRAACARIILLAPVVLAPVLGLVEIPLSAAETSKMDETKGAEWRLGHVLGVSDTGLVAPRLRPISGSGALLGRLTAYMEDVVSGPGADFNCGVRKESEWTAGLEGFSLLRSWPLAKTDCVSTSLKRKAELATKPEAALKMTREFWEMRKKTVAGILDDAGKDIKALFEQPTLGDWKHSHGRYQQCTLDRLTAVRLRLRKDARAQWYFLSGITNTDHLQDLANNRRYYLTEWIGVDSENRFVDPLPMKLRRWDGSDGEGNITASEDPSANRTKFTTSFERWGGRVSLSAIYTLSAEDSPALKLALDKSDVAAGQAEDALTASNIGILALPMALNVIPVALVADVSSFGLFVYTVMTDILTTIPFIVKGFELFLSGSKTFAAQEVYYTDLTGGSETVSGKGGWIVAESWMTECHLVDLRRIGSIFISIGFTVIFLGVFLEYQAQRLRSRWIAKVTGTHRNVVMADGLEADMRERYGLNPRMPTDPYVAEEEQSFLDNQVKSIPPKVHAPGPLFRSSSKLEGRLARLSGVSGPSSGQKVPPSSGQTSKR